MATIDPNNLLYRLQAAGLFIFLLGFFVLPSPGSHETIYYIFVMLPFFLLLPFNFREFVNLNSSYILLIILMVYYMGSMLWSQEFNSDTLYYFSRRLFYISCLILTVKSVIDHFPLFDQFAVKFFIVIGSCLFSLCLFNYFYLHGLSMPRFNPEPGSMITLGRFENAIRCAWILGSMVLISLWMLLREREQYLKIFYSLSLIPSFLLLMLTQSRGAILPFIVCLPIVICLSRDSGRVKILGLILGVLIMSGLWLFFTPTGNNLLSDLIKRGLSFRIDIWSAVLNETKGDLIFGQGLRKNSDIITELAGKFNHSHNFVLSVLRFSGITGVLLLLAMVGQCLKEAFTNTTENMPLWGILLLFGSLCLFTNGKFPLSSPRESWFIFWLPIAFICAHAGNSRKRINA